MPDSIGCGNVLEGEKPEGKKTMSQIGLKKKDLRVREMMTAFAPGSCVVQVRRANAATVRVWKHIRRLMGS